MYWHWWLLLQSGLWPNDCVMTSVLYWHQCRSLTCWVLCCMYKASLISKIISDGLEVSWVMMYHLLFNRVHSHCLTHLLLLLDTQETPFYAEKVIVFNMCCIIVTLFLLFYKWRRWECIKKKSIYIYFLYIFFSKMRGKMSASSDWIKK